MDLNYLFHRQQVERSRARAARTPQARQAHEELAHRYEEQIARLTAEEFNIRPDDDVTDEAAHAGDILPRDGNSGANRIAVEGPANH